MLAVQWPELLPQQMLPTRLRGRFRPPGLRLRTTLASNPCDAPSPPSCFGSTHPRTAMLGNSKVPHSCAGRGQGIKALRRSASHLRRVLPAGFDVPAAPRAVLPDALPRQRLAAVVGPLDDTPAPPRVGRGCGDYEMTISRSGVATATRSRPPWSQLTARTGMAASLPNQRCSSKRAMPTSSHAIPCRGIAQAVSARRRAQISGRVRSGSS